MCKKRKTFRSLIWAGSLSALFLLIRMLPLYKSVPEDPFSGPHWYNPYEHAVPGGRWLRANFHAHSNAWGIVTNGRKNTVGDILCKYDSLGYDIVGISDYQHITQTGKELYIPCYEHGFNILKTHQGSIGARDVYHNDYILPQTRSQKQHVINRLARRSELVVLNHPDWMGGYSQKDIRQLTGYDLFEVLNDFRISEELWDVALSAGKPAMLLGGDDAHNVFKQTDLARDLTVIYTNSDTVTPAAVYNALRNGTAYGIEVTGDLARATVTEKRAGLDAMPLLTSCKIIHDSLIVTLTGEADHFSFIGQNGRLLSKVSDTGNGLSSAHYMLQPEDTYVRVRISLPDSTRLYLNPVMRTGREREKPLMPASQKRWLFTIFDK